MTSKSFGATIFGTVAGEYAKHRLQYPDELFEFLATLSPSRKRALDIGTGNGQAAVGLAKFFDWIDATDTNFEQLKNALPSEKVNYIQLPAESSTLTSAAYDLITVAMAVHWFELDSFYRNVRRLLKPQGVLAVFGYSSPDAQFSPAVQAVLKEHLNDLIDPFWAPQVRLLVDGYRNLLFPFDEVSAPSFEIKKDYTVDSWIGLVATWSAVKSYESTVDSQALGKLREKLVPVWPGKESVVLPLHLRVARL